jgi:hypothetical protein
MSRKLIQADRKRDMGRAAHSRWVAEQSVLVMEVMD